MSSKTTTPAAEAVTAKAPASDKVEVSFATDEEEESSSEEEEDETTSSSGSGDEKNSDGDGDADDESEMPTFTLSLQPSTEANDVDDTLPDLSLSAASLSKQDIRQETVVEKIETEAKIATATSQSTSSSSKVDSGVSDLAEETSPKPSIPATEEAKEESAEESVESEESEEETEDKKEEEKDKEQHLHPSSTAATSSSTPASPPTIDAKEGTAKTSSKLSVTESKIHVEETQEEQTAVTAAVEAKPTLNADKTTTESDAGVAEVEDKHTSAIAKAEEKPLAKETAVTEHVSNVNLSKSTTEITHYVEEKSLSNAQLQPSKKNKDSAQTEAKVETGKADTTDSASPSANITEHNDLKYEDTQKETRSTDKKSAKSLDTETTVTKLPETGKAEESSELIAREQSEPVDNSKPSKSRETKVDAKETKQEVTSTVEEEQTVSVTVVTKQNVGKSQSEEVKTNKTITDVNTEVKVNTEKIKEVPKLDKSDKVGEATTVETTDKSEELIKESVKGVISSTDTRTKTNAVEVTVNGSAAKVDEVERSAEPEWSEAKISSKKKSKHSTVDVKESESKRVATDSPAAASDDGKCAGNISESKVGVESDISSTAEVSKTDTVKSSVAAAAGPETKKNVAEIQPSKDESVPAANLSSNEVKVDDTKLKSAEDEGKLLLAGDDAEYRPRRNSIDEFIKRILAEAREEQKKILDSCAASSGETASETSVSVSAKASDSLASSKGTELELQQQQQPVVNGIDVGSTSRRNREDVDIDEELADISRYYAKRTLVDRVLTNEDEVAEAGSATQATRSEIVANGDETASPTSNDEVLHFVPRRRESTATVVRESSRPVRALVDQQAGVIRRLTEMSRAVDDLDNEIRQLRQSTGGREALYASIGAAIRDELRIYETELTASGERVGQQKLPGGGHFVREQFVSQCAAELLQRSAVTNGPRLERAATVDEWTLVGRRRSGSFSVDEELGGSSRIAARPWIPAALDRDTTDLMMQLRHSRSGSVVSDRGYSSVDTVDESRATTSSLLSRLASFDGSSTAAELDFGRYSRASSELPRPSYPRSQTISDDWTPTGSSSYSVGRQYVVSMEDTGGELDVGYRVSAAARPPVGQLSYRRYQPTSVVDSASRLHVRRGSLQSYSSYDSGDGGRSFNSRFLSRVREKKALGDSTSRATTGDRPFRSRFLKPSGAAAGSTSTTYSSSRSAAQYEYDADDQ